MHLVFVDESGLLLIPTLRRTWAPRGQTPFVYHCYRHDRLSVISGVSISPIRRRLGLYFRCHRHNIQRPDVCAFFRYLLRHLRGHVIVLLDNAAIHKGEPIRTLCRREGIVTNLYYRWSKEFLEAGKKQLQGDTRRDSTPSSRSSARQRGASFFRTRAPIPTRKSAREELDPPPRDFPSSKTARHQ